MPSQTQSLSRLLKKESFVYVPEAYDALGARPVEKTGFKAADEIARPRCKCHQNLLSSSCGQFCVLVTLKKRAIRIATGSAKPHDNTINRPCHVSKLGISWTVAPLSGVINQLSH